MLREALRNRVVWLDLEVFTLEPKSKKTAVVEGTLEGTVICCRVMFAGTTTSVVEEFIDMLELLASEAEPPVLTTKATVADSLV